MVNCSLNCSWDFLFDLRVPEIADTPPMTAPKARAVGVNPPIDATLKPVLTPSVIPEALLAFGSFGFICDVNAPVSTGRPNETANALLCNLACLFSEAPKLRLVKSLSVANFPSAPNPLYSEVDLISLIILAFLNPPNIPVF